MPADKKSEKDMPVTSHPGGHRNDADPEEESKRKENNDITLQSQKGKKVDADPSNPDDKPAKDN